MKKQIQTLRLTAKVLLIATPAMMVSGFLTAKPFLADFIDFQTARLIHTIAAPLLFVPLLIIHTTAGILYMAGRNKSTSKPQVKWTLAGGWIVLLATLSVLYFAGSPQEVEQGALSSFDDPADALTTEDADLTSRSADGDAPRTDADFDIEDEPRAASDIDADLSALDAAESSKSRRDEVQVSRSDNNRPRAKGQPLSPRSSNGSKNEAKTKSENQEDDEPETKRLSGSVLVQQRCLGCHPASVVYGTKRTPAGWNSTIARMMAMGAQLNSEERAVVTRYLIRRAGIREEP